MYRCLWMKGSVLILVSTMIVIVATLFAITTAVGGEKYDYKIRIEELDANRAISLFNIEKEVTASDIRLNSMQAMFGLEGCTKDNPYWYEYSNTKDSNPTTCVPELKDFGELWMKKLKSLIVHSRTSNNVKVEIDNLEAFVYKQSRANFEADCNGQCTIELTFRSSQKPFSDGEYVYSVKDGIIEIEVEGKKYVFVYDISGEEESIKENPENSVNGVITLRGINNDVARGVLEYTFKVEGSDISIQSVMREKTADIKTELVSLFKNSGSYSDVIEQVNDMSDSIYGSLDLQYTTSSERNSFLDQVESNVMDALDDESGGSNGEFSINGYDIIAEVETKDLFVPGQDDKFLGDQKGLLYSATLVFTIFDKEENYVYWNGTNAEKKPFDYSGQTKLVKTALECNSKKLAKFTYASNNDMFCSNEGELYACDVSISGLDSKHKINLNGFIDADGNKDCEIAESECYKCTDAGFCSKTDAKISEGCCKGLGYNWEDGVCKGDDFCDSSNGETEDNSADCRKE